MTEHHQNRGLEGRLAFVSGGGRGIGRAIALGLAADGADVAIGYRRDQESAASTVEAIEALGRRAAAYPGDVASHPDNAATAAAVEDELGPVDLLVHNAGVASRGQDVVRTEPDEVGRLFAAHAYGGWSLANLFVPGMRERPRGDVVFISSAAVVLMAPMSAPYNMAKAALEALAWTLAKEERRHGIHVNVVAPGLVDTEMGRRLVRGAMGVDDIRTMDGTSPFGHVCSPDEVADAVRFLVGPQGGYLTAQRLGVDGGPF
jgi:3-oxoacyl-[acyl-carrier protein] reductase